MNSKSSQAADEQAQTILNKSKDERVKVETGLQKLLKRPELGAVAGFAIVTIFFIIFANPVMFSLSGIKNWMEPAAQLGILAVGAALLMIAGEFDLSIGSMIAFAGFVFGVLVLNGAPLIIAIPLTFLAAGAIGYVNGEIVLKTGLPSFIVTLAFLFILQGAALIGHKLATGGATQIRGVREAIEGDFLTPFFSGEIFSNWFVWLAEMGWIETFKNGTPKISGVPIEVVWFIVLTAFAAYILQRTAYGNWIFAAGGDANAASNSGVPVRRVKLSLFIFTACCAALVAIITVSDLGSTDVKRGFQKEFHAIIAAVVGGCLLTGGYGSVVGAAIGAVIFGMTVIGLSYTKFDSDWFLVVLGAVLLLAVIFNNYIRKRATGQR